MKTNKGLLKTFFALLVMGVFMASVMIMPGVSVEAKPKKDIVDTAIAAGSFNTLAKALEAAGLIDALKSKGQFTVFAPTDEAFAKLPEGTIEALLKPENKEKLKAILLYHVVKGNVPAKTVVTLNGKMVKTLQGGELTISTVDGVKVNDSNVIKTDVVASNGVIHVIDTVLLPKM